jgi:hypothetical protein
MSLRADFTSRPARPARRYGFAAPTTSAHLPGRRYGALRSAADACDAWHLESGAARQALERSDRRAFVSALLDDGDDELASNAASRSASDELGHDLLLRLADRRQSSHPSEAPIVCTRVVDEILVETDRRAYRRDVQILKHARVAAQAAGETDAFATNLARLHEVHRRRPTFIATLDKAKLTDT